MKFTEEELLKMDRYELFGEVLKKLKEDTHIIFSPNNICEDDRFLIFGSWRKSIECTFKRSYSGVWKVYFDGDEPMLLENCPTSFFRSILLNI